jgi:hypothetical protein
MTTAPWTRRARLTLMLTLLAGLAAGFLAARPAGAASLQYADPAFSQVWARADGPVAGHQATRSWYWGPAPGMIVREPFAGLPGGSHLVQYFDKSRMEINDPNGDRSSKWFVTNGLLAIELISGRIQTGLTSFQNGQPANIPLASDSDDTTAPTYASFLGVSNTSRGDHPATSRMGGAVTATIDRAGQVGQDTSRAMDATRIAYFDPKTHHNIPGVFWTFLNASGPVQQGGGTVQAPLSDPWNFATGLPISEAYWARVKIAGQPQWVLIQAFERRVLTFVPAFAPEWRVQMGNIGQHYYEYRYGHAAATLAGVLARTAAQPSYHFTSIMVLHSSGVTVPFARQAGDYQGPDRTHLVQQALDGLSEIITIGTSVYVSSTTTGGHWQKQATSGGFDLSSLVGVMQYGSNVTPGPDSVVNGVASNRLHMNLDPAAIPKLEGVSYSAADADLDVAAATGLPVRLHGNITLAPGSARQGSIEVTVDFSNYGEAVRIEPPLP